MDVEVVLDFRTLRHHGDFHVGNVEQGRDLELRPLHPLSGRDLAEIEVAEERELHPTVAV